MVAKSKDRDGTISLPVREGRACGRQVPYYTLVYYAGLAHTNTEAQHLSLQRHTGTLRAQLFHSVSIKRENTKV
jgi:hypothetical protein